LDWAVEDSKHLRDLGDQWVDQVGEEVAVLKVSQEANLRVDLPVGLAPVLLAVPPQGMEVADHQQAMAVEQEVADHLQAMAVEQERADHLQDMVVEQERADHLQAMVVDLPQEALVD
jgi:predicted metallo-beta-lactamase superfamily hydrolase